MQFQSCQICLGYPLQALLWEVYESCDVWLVKHRLNTGQALLEFSSFWVVPLSVVSLVHGSYK